MEEDLLGTFSRTRKPYLNGSGSSAWGVHEEPELRHMEVCGLVVVMSANGGIGCGRTPCSIALPCSAY
jgi:hypothetical protein